jgi:hypothetical protein
LLGNPGYELEGQSAAKPYDKEGSTTIPKGSTAKRLEMGASSLFWMKI